MDRWAVRIIKRDPLKTWAGRVEKSTLTPFFDPHFNISLTKLFGFLKPLSVTWME
jgi:hypothetical protein